MQTKSEPEEDDDVELNLTLNDGSKHFKIDFKIYKLFDGVAHTGILLDMIPETVFIILYMKMVRKNICFIMRFILIRIKLILVK